MHDRLRLIEKRDVDELIILDIAATREGRGPKFEELTKFCDNLFMPVTIGGGVRNVGDIRRLLRSGADKVAIGAAAIENSALIQEAAEAFGSQAVVVSIDVQQGFVWHSGGKIHTELCPSRHAVDAERRGAGEILLTSIERDGILGGFDLGLIRSVSDAVGIPVIAAGGCGSYDDIAAALEAGAHAVAVGAAFQFMDLTPKGACRYLRERGFEVRL